ncbi:hypothetical protein [Promicromonospora soli]
MADPRGYTTGTERALYFLSRGTCYYPGCDEPVMKFVEGLPISNAQIAHINGANPNSARYESTMTDEERAAFTNLILTCKPHHDLIDRIRPTEHPADLLRTWKAEREKDTLTALNGLRGLTEDRLAEMLEEASRSQAPQREVVVELTGIALHEGISGISLPPEAWRETIERSPRLAEVENALVTLVQNVGYEAAGVEEVGLKLFRLVGDDEETVAVLVGANHYPDMNQQLPKRLEPGAPEIKWLHSVQQLYPVLRTLSADDGVRIRAYARLSSGERIPSESFSISLIPFDLVVDAS